MHKNSGDNFSHVATKETQPVFLLARRAMNSMWIPYVPSNSDEQLSNFSVYITQNWQLQPSSTDNPQTSESFRLKGGRVPWKGHTFYLMHRINHSVPQKPGLFQEPDMTNRFFATSRVTQRGHSTKPLLVWQREKILWGKNIRRWSG